MVSENEPVEPNGELATPTDRVSVVWRCSSGKGAGRPIHKACGKLNAQWTKFDPHIGGNRKRRWLGHCAHCPKVTAINPTTGNIVKVFSTRNEGIVYAMKRNASEATQRALEAQENDHLAEGWLA